MSMCVCWGLLKGKYQFVQQMLPDGLLCARHSAGQWVCRPFPTLRKLWSSHTVTNCLTLLGAFSAETGRALSKPGRVGHPI